MKDNRFDKTPELLAPAGSFICLQAAVQNGADAVYLGLKTGSARMGAENFTFPELEEAIRYAHIRGVRVYLALNTLLFENELEQAYDAAGTAAAMGIDALILQDLGLAEKIIRNRQYFPCALHASTQMSIYNEEGLHFLEQMGFDRCIAARELSISEIEKLCSAQKADIEVFCHGALCMSLSGQCLLSSFIGGRSGNRGTCAQPCRRKYALEDGNSCAAYAYRLSPSDFAALPHIDALCRAGVRSLKIEGRLKSPAYVALTTRYYRQAIDQMCTDVPGKMRDLQLLFGRGDFTAGYLFGKLPFEDITFRSAGRLGIPVGRIKTFPLRLPAPKKLPQNLVRYRFTVLYDSASFAVKPGDGITIYETGKEEVKAVAGGAVNAVRCGTDPHSAQITAVGSLGVPGSGPFILSVTEDAKLRKEAENSLQADRRKVPVTLAFTAREGEKPVLEMRDACGNLCRAAAAVPAERARKEAVSEEEIRKQLGKLGDTPYIAEKIEICADSGLFLPISVLNTLRRDCAAQLSAQRSLPRRRPVCAPAADMGQAEPAPGGISFFFYHLDGFLAFAEDAMPKALRPYGGELRTYYIPLDTFYEENGPSFSQAESQIAALRKAGPCRIAAYFPLISLGAALTGVRKHLPEILERYTGTLIDGFLCENPGDLAFLNLLLEGRSEKPMICCDYSFNAANSCALRFLGHSGANRAALSPEAAPDCLAAAAAALNPEVVVGGRIVLMRSRHCYIDEGECGGRKAKCTRGKFSLKDEYGCKFPIIAQKDDCCSILLSHKPVSYSAWQIEKIRSLCPEATLRVNME